MVKMVKGVALALCALLLVSEASAIAFQGGWGGKHHPVQEQVPSCVPCASNYCSSCSCDGICLECVSGGYHLQNGHCVAFQQPTQPISMPISLGFTFGGLGALFLGGLLGGHYKSSNGKDHGGYSKPPPRPRPPPRPMPPPHPRPPPPSWPSIPPLPPVPSWPPPMPSKPVKPPMDGRRYGGHG